MMISCVFSDARPSTSSTQRLRRCARLCVRTMTAITVVSGTGVRHGLLGDLTERNKLYLKPVNRFPYRGIAEGSDLLDALVAIPRVEAFGVAGVATQLRDDGRQGLEHPEESVRRDRVRIRPVVAVVPVEITTEPDPGIEVAKR